MRDESADAVVRALRALLWVESVEQAARVTATLIEDLGGAVVPLRNPPAPPDHIPLDVSFGVGETMVAWAPPLSIARLHLERELPPFVEDARRAIALAARVERLSEEVVNDPLTGVANRRGVEQALGRLPTGTPVVLIDLDFFKAVNDSWGHAEGDAALQGFADTLSSCCRHDDIVGRMGGEEFLVLLNPGADPEAFLARVRAAWEQVRAHPITFSAGVAVTRAGDIAEDTLEAADKALYEAKSAGRDCWRWATL